MSEWGRVAFRLYRAATLLATPAASVFIRWRRFRGLEHRTRWPERFGRPSSPRPPGPLLWFHAVSLGEGLAAIPVIKHCILQAPHFSVLMTTTTTSAFEVIKDQLPNGVIYQFSPIDTPKAVDNFLAYWKPSAIFLMESELWPNLIISASEKEIPVALLNARMSLKSFRRWSRPVALSLISLMLSKLSLIASLSTVEAIHFQLLQAPPLIINFTADLKYAVGDFDLSENENRNIEDLKRQLTGRPAWMAASIHKGEEEVMLWVHKKLMEVYPEMVTILVTRHPQHGEQISQALKRQGVNVALRSRNDIVSPSTSIYVVDTLGELRTLYRVTPIAVIGGSFLPDLAGHNISEAAAAGCAVLTGPHMGHFSRMITEMRCSDPLSVVQVGDRMELLKVLNQLLSNPQVLEAHQISAKQSFLAVSSGVVQSVWNLINSNVLSKHTSFPKESQGGCSRS
ncbi:putative 3-deoxy-D-manno-octulosonic acid transferase, mitochondrial [Iris pallida]|uniref:lipid IVA 3-deoxy-D-manno-octulosonic acid transferase n=1 Tax=Iris pallida TaxID=29817 RepID=A0AAX6DY80_IRIPA|nr:putative 3-deoxy-D-manno-octulosonic acid transferase, mitochondrial [Iris pallida]